MSAVVYRTVHAVIQLGTFFVAWVMGAFGLAQTPAPVTATAGVIELAPGMTHLRSSEVREWADFPERAEHQTLTRSFESRVNARDWTLSIRQQDVKQDWEVLLNELPIGRLVRDEKDRISDYLVRSGTLREGTNQLQIRQTGTPVPDDVRVGQIQLRALPPAEFRHQASVRIEINDADGKPLPARVTVVDAKGTLVPLGAESSDQLAVRQGVAYTASGVAQFGLAAGRYRVYAGRGFEYSIDSCELDLQSGQTLTRTLQLRREVDTTGWVACDTHIHTVTHSGHGDATVAERMLTLAGEGIELPIATDHNKHIDYRPIAKQLDVDRFFTPVIGNEVTTPRGHFNIFPIEADATKPDHEQTDWEELFEDIFAVPGVRVAILNHGRDLHSGFRPLSARHHISISGERTDGRSLRANAMEVINSGAVQSDPMQLFADWCGLLNRGHAITPIGCSDSHDVSRYIVGQARTYIRCEDADAGNLNAAAAIQALLDGRVSVSYGLFATLQIQGAGSGELASWASDAESLVVNAQVRAPSWVKPKTLELYMNGRALPAATKVLARPAAGEPSDFQMQWSLAREQIPHDAWFTVVARGEGITEPYWPSDKPYQPDSIEFTPYTFAISGPVRVDRDGDNAFTSAFEYAQRIVAKADGNVEQILQELEAFDPSVATQAASMLLADSRSEPRLQQAASAAAGEVRAAVGQYLQARRASVIATLEQNEAR